MMICMFVWMAHPNSCISSSFLLFTHYKKNISSNFSKFLTFFSLVWKPIKTIYDDFENLLIFWQAFLRFFFSKQQQQQRQQPSFLINQFQSWTGIFNPHFFYSWNLIETKKKKKNRKTCKLISLVVHNYYYKLRLMKWNKKKLMRCNGKMDSSNKKIVSMQRL